MENKLKFIEQLKTFTYDFSNLTIFAYKDIIDSLIIIIIIIKYIQCYNIIFYCM